MYRERTGMGSIVPYLAEAESVKGASQYLKERGGRIAIGGTAYLGALGGLYAAKDYLSVSTLPYAAASMGVGALTALGVLGAIFGAGWFAYKGIRWLWKFAKDRMEETKQRQTAPAPD